MTIMDLTEALWNFSPWFGLACSTFFFAEFILHLGNCLICSCSLFRVSFFNCSWCYVKRFPIYVPDFELNDFLNVSVLLFIVIALSTPFLRAGWLKFSVIFCHLVTELVTISLLSVILFLYAQLLSCGLLIYAS